MSISSDNDRPSVHAAILKGIVKSYRIESVEVQALRGVDLEIRSQCLTAILPGPGAHSAIRAR